MNFYTVKIYDPRRRTKVSCFRGRQRSNRYLDVSDTALMLNSEF
jgi:hypothetical protein